MIFKYTFEDETVLRLLDNCLSAEEVWKLEELHGKCRGVSIYCWQKARGNYGR